MTRKSSQKPTLTVRSEESPEYATRTKSNDDAIVAQAMQILAGRLRKTEDAFTSPQDVKDYLALRISSKDHEVFVVLFLDAQHRLIVAEEMFRGTLTQTSVYPREVVKAAIAHNAAAVVLAHNHPSGHVEPSRADETLTQTLKSALALVDVRVLDHVVVSFGRSVSMAERGMI